MERKKDQPKAAQEAVYEVSEFAANAEKIFGGGANADIVNAAFLVEGKDKATVSEAKRIVAKFMNKGVK